MPRGKPKKKYDPTQLGRCPFCAGRADGTNPTVHITHMPGGGVMLTCRRCEYSSKIFDHKLEMIRWFNTRGGRVPPPLKIEVIHQRQEYQSGGEKIVL